MICICGYINGYDMKLFSNEKFESYKLPNGILYENLC